MSRGAPGLDQANGRAPEQRISEKRDEGTDRSVPLGPVASPRAPPPHHVRPSKSRKVLDRDTSVPSVLLPLTSSILEPCLHYSSNYESYIHQSLTRHIRGYIREIKSLSLYRYAQGQIDVDLPLATHALIVSDPILVVDCWWQQPDSIRVTYLAKYSGYRLHTPQCRVPTGGQLQGFLDRRPPTCIGRRTMCELGDIGGSNGSLRHGESKGLWWRQR